MATVKPIITVSGSLQEMGATDTIDVSHVPVMVGATSVAPGSVGLVPAAASGDQAKLLGADGLWHTPGGGSSITVQDEGTTLTSMVVLFNFVGSGVTATNSGNNVTVTIPGGGGSLSITANRAAVSDGSGNLIAATTTDTEIGYVAGVTSAIQTQLNSKQSISMPQNVQSANYTFVATDAGCQILHPASDNNARTFTVPANSSVPFPVNTIITVVNEVNAVFITSADTIATYGGDSTDNYILYPNGIVYLQKITSTKWVIWGTGFLTAGTATTSSASAILACGSTPYVVGYIFQAGFATRVATPGVLPASQGQGASMMASKAAIAIAHSTTPFLSIYGWATGFLTKYADPASLAAGNGEGIGFSPDNAAVVMGHTTTPFISGWPWSASTGFGTKFSNPGSLPAADCRGIVFSSTSSYVFAAHNTTPYISAWPFSSSTGFGTKVANPSTLATNNACAIAITPTNSHVAIGWAVSTYLNIYVWTGSAFGSKVSDPGTLPTGTPYGVAFSPNGSYFMCGSQSSPYADIYPWSAGYGSKYADPGTALTQNAYQVAFAPGNDYVMMAGMSSPYMWAYSFSSGWGTKCANPANYPASSGAGGTANNLSFS